MVVAVKWEGEGLAFSMALDWGDLYFWTLEALGAALIRVVNCVNSDAYDERSMNLTLQHCNAASLVTCFVLCTLYNRNALRAYTESKLSSVLSSYSSLLYSNEHCRSRCVPLYLLS